MQGKLYSALFISQSCYRQRSHDSRKKVPGFMERLESSSRSGFPGPSCRPGLQSSIHEQYFQVQSTGLSREEGGGLLFHIQHKLLTLNLRSRDTGRHRDIKTVKQIHRALDLLVHSQMPTEARNGPQTKLRSGNLIQTLTGCQRPSKLSHHLLPPEVSINKESETQPGIKLRHSSIGCKRHNQHLSC